MGSASRSCTQQTVSFQFGVDYFKLNAVTKLDFYTVASIDACFHALQETSIFSAVKANWEYWYVEIDNEDGAKTALTLRHGLYQFVRMPPGLWNA